MGTPVAPPWRQPTITVVLFNILLYAAAAADPDDVVCLKNLHASLQDPTNNLGNWSTANINRPCGESDSPLHGATCNNGRIFKISLPGLSLGGSISPFISNCSNLQTLDLSSNLISGQIPSDLRLLQNLAVLNLSVNLLSGEIPADIASCAFLNIIDLHGNTLSGVIPPQLGSLSRLSAFDVSDNHLSGPIPPSLANRTALLPRFNASSFRGNKGLYGYPLDAYRPNKGLSVVAIVGIGLASGFLSLVISFTVVCVWLRLTDRKLAAEEAKVSHLMPDY
ncbi:uncharacterized protein [Phyllobates terribilis]|uniref:uncharacterized protein n=1 Tax=Phyllobates terribilis TaxID=111132 RepID=UPI003CCB5397